MEIGEMEIRLLDEVNDVWSVEIGDQVFDVTGRDNVQACIDANIISPLEQMLKLFYSSGFIKGGGNFIIYNKPRGKPYFVVSHGSDKNFNADVPWKRRLVPPAELTPE